MNALERLKLGNSNYIRGIYDNSNLSQDIRDRNFKDGQHPYAVVLTCSDSRVPVESIFSAGIGEIFTIRVAGNVIDDVVLGSVVYAIEHLKVSLILVLGHTMCGAVAGAINGGVEGIISSITNKIKNCIGDEKDSSKAEILNVKNSVSEIKNNKTIYRLIQENKLSILGGIYNIKSGEVYYIDGV